MTTARPRVCTSTASTAIPDTTHVCNSPSNDKPASHSLKKNDCTAAARHTSPPPIAQQQHVTHSPRLHSSCTSHIPPIAQQQHVTHPPPPIAQQQHVTQSPPPPQLHSSSTLHIPPPPPPPPRLHSSSTSHIPPPRLHSSSTSHIPPPPPPDCTAAAARHTFPPHAYFTRIVYPLAVDVKLVLVFPNRQISNKGEVIIAAVAAKKTAAEKEKTGLHLACNSTAAA